METTESPSSATFNAAEMTHSIESTVAGQESTIGSYTATIHEQAQTLMHAGGMFYEVGEQLEADSEEVLVAADGMMDIAIDADMPTSHLGQAVVSGEQGDITVNADLLTDPSLLPEVIMHEVRHTEEVMPQDTGGEALLITEHKQEMENTTQVLEGDTTTHTAPHFGSPVDSPRDYQHGFAVATEVRQKYAKEWDDALLRTGDLSEIQKKIWLEQLRKGTIDIRTVMEEAKRTRHLKAAVEAVAEYLEEMEMAQV